MSNTELNKEILDILDNVIYWETCPKDYKVRIKAIKKQLTLTDVSSCYAIFDEEDNIVQLYQTEKKANKGMEEFKRSHEHTDFYVDTIQIH